MYYKVNVKKKRLSKGKKILIDDSKPVKDFKIPNDKISIQDIERLYDEYKYSIPIETNKYTRYTGLFKALPLDKLSDNDLITRKPRPQAKFDLEYALLIGIINKSLCWEDFADPNHYFWVSPTDPDLVILKEWFM